MRLLGAVTRSRRQLEAVILPPSRFGYSKPLLSALDLSFDQIAHERGSILITPRNIDPLSHSKLSGTLLPAFTRAALGLTNC